MELINKAAVVAEIEGLSAYLDSLHEQRIIEKILSFIDTLEVKEVNMPALDNGNMPVERWKEACEAASCQANYRKSKGLTETCDDYFVDGVQWADEHPKKVKEMDLDFEKELYKAFGQVKDFTLGMCIARHFYELGLKTKKGE